MIPAKIFSNHTFFRADKSLEKNYHTKNTFKDTFKLGPPFKKEILNQRYEEMQLKLEKENMARALDQAPQKNNKDKQKKAATAVKDALSMADKIYTKSSVY